MLTSTWFRRSTCGLTLASALLLMSCEAPKQLGPGLLIDDLIPRVTNADGTVSAVLRTGPAPTGGIGNAATISGIGSVVNGGSSQINLSAGAAFNTVIVAVPGFTNYWELTLPADVSASDVVVGISPQLTTSNFQIRYAVVSGGAIGAYAVQNVRVTHVGTGDVQVSVSWSGASDVDLHVYDPNGEEVYYGHRQGASGGTLDLDSNPACQLDNVNNENIVWPTDVAPHGTYTVHVAYYDDCNAAESDYVLTVQAKGQNPQIFTGSFVGVHGVSTPDRIVPFTY
jgi:hypothetical protein